jgi:hypothetical protein
MLALLTSALLVGACGGSDDMGPDTGANDASSSEGSGGSGATESSGAADSTGAQAELHFATDVWPILDGACYCHISTPPGTPFNTDFFMGPGVEEGYAAIVNQPSSVAGLDFVELGSSADSYLYHKVAGTFVSVGGGGDPMPLGGTLTAEDRATIERWIDGGALE